MLHQGSPDAAMRIQSIFYRLLLLTATDFWGLKWDRKIEKVNRSELETATF